MDPWSTAGITLLKMLAASSSANNASHTYERDVRDIVQEELRRSQNHDQVEILREVMRLMDEKKRAEKEEEDEKMLKAKVEELSQKLEKLERNKKVTDNREWMMGMVEKMTAANQAGQQPREYPGGPQPREYPGGPIPYVPQPRQYPARPFPNKMTNDMRKSTDHLPWMDTPKSIPNEDNSFVMVDPQDCNFSHRGRGQYHHRGRGRGHHPRSVSSDGRGNTQQGDASRGKNYHQRGNYRGQGRGAIPRNPTGGQAAAAAGEVNVKDIKQLNAKLQNLSTNDVQVSLSPKDIVFLQSALQTMNSTENQNKGRKKQGNPNQGQAKQGNPNQGQAKQGNPNQGQAKQGNQGQGNKGNANQGQGNRGNTNQDGANQGPRRNPNHQRRDHDRRPRRQNNQVEESDCCLM